MSEGEFKKRAIQTCEKLSQIDEPIRDDYSIPVKFRTRIMGENEGFVVPYVVIDEARREFPRIEKHYYVEDGLGRKTASFLPLAKYPQPEEYEKWFLRWFGSENKGDDK